MNMPLNIIYSSKNMNYFSAEKTHTIGITSFVIKGYLFFLKYWNINKLECIKLFEFAAL